MSTATLRESMEALTLRLASLEKTIAEDQLRRPRFVQLNDRRTHEGFVVATVTDEQRKAWNKRVSDDLIRTGLDALWEKTSTKVAASAIAFATVGGFVLEVVRLLGGH